MPEMHEGPTAYARFREAMRAILQVPHAEIQRRIEQHKKEAAQNPHKRGPKPKRGGAGPAPAV
jgi:hypothetical protein